MKARAWEPPPEEDVRALEQEEALQRLRQRGVREVEVRPTCPLGPWKVKGRWRVIQQRPRGQGYVLIVAREMAPEGERE